MTKHIEVEVDYHFICVKILNKDLQAYYISIYGQPLVIFTKGLFPSHFLLMVPITPINLRGMLDKIYNTIESESSRDKSHLVLKIMQ